MRELVLGSPHPRQIEFFEDHHKIVGFGGARGGGKSWALDNKAVRMCLRFPKLFCLIIRRTYPELYNNHIRPLTTMLKCHAGSRDRIAKYNDSKKEITFGNGSIIRFGYLDAEKDLGRYQGLQCDVLMIDEATQIPEEWYDQLKVIVRGTNGLPKRTYITCNPGGVGHGWVKRLFIDKQYREGERAEDYGFTQSLVTDNLTLMQEQPDYYNQLMSLPPKLRAAWLEGQWDVYEGQVFEEFRTRPLPQNCGDKSPEEMIQQRRWTHVIEPFDIGYGECRNWTILRGYDFGYNRPFSVAWYAVDYEGVMYRILEMYGWTGEANTGCRWTPEKQAEEVLKVEQTHPWLKGRKIDGVADPAIFDSSRGPSVAEDFMAKGIYFQPGDHKRIPGWMQCHYRLQFDAEGYSRFYVFRNCTEFIRTLPLLSYSKTVPEDVDSDGEDHCLAGDTKVLTDEGYKRITDMVGTEGLVYSSDHKLHRYHDVRMTRKDADILVVTMEDGTKIYCTDDHRFMLPDGSWIRAVNLSAGAEVKDFGSTGDQQNDSEV